jgi:hypothetical protein
MSVWSPKTCYICCFQAEAAVASSKAQTIEPEQPPPQQQQQQKSPPRKSSAKASKPQTSTNGAAAPATTKAAAPAAGAAATATGKQEQQQQQQQGTGDQKSKQQEQQQQQGPLPKDGYVCAYAAVPLTELALGYTTSSFKVPLLPKSTIRGAGALDWKTRPGNYLQVSRSCRCDHHTSQHLHSDVNLLMCHLLSA